MPETFKLIQLQREGKSARGVNWFRVLDELDQRRLAGQISMTDLSRLGVSPGDLHKFRNNINQHIESVLGRSSPAGIALRERVQKITGKHRAFGTAPREAAFLHGTASERQVRAHQATTKTFFKRAEPGFRQEIRPGTERKVLEKIEGKLDAADKAAARGDLTRAKAREAVRQIINDSNRLPGKTETSRLEAALTRLRPALRKLKNLLPGLTPKEQVAGVDRVVQAQRAARGGAFAAGEEQRIFEAATEAAKPKLAPRIGKRKPPPTEGSPFEHAGAERRTLYREVESKLPKPPRDLGTSLAAALERQRSAPVRVGRGVHATTVSPAELSAIDRASRLAAMEELRKPAPHPKLEPPKPSLEELGKGKVTKQLERKSRIRKLVTKKGAPKEARKFDISHPERAKGSFKVEPKEYELGKPERDVVSLAQQEAPLHGAATRLRTDNAAATKFTKWIEAKRQSLHTGGLDITEGVIDSMGFTGPTKSSLKRTLANLTGEGVEKLKKFEGALQEVAVHNRRFMGKPASFREIFETLIEAGKRTTQPLAKELAKLTPEGKLTPFKARKGPWGARTTTTIPYRNLATEGGGTLKDPHAGARGIALLAERELGLKKGTIDEDFLESVGTSSARFGKDITPGKDDITPVLALGKEEFGPARGKAKLLSAGSGKHNLYSLVDVVKAYVTKHGAGDPVLLNNPYYKVPDQQAASAYKLELHTEPGKAFQYDVSRRVPESLQPLQPGKVRPSGKRGARAATFELPDVDVAKGSRAIATADIYGKPSQGAFDFGSALDKPSINLPRFKLEPGEVRASLSQKPLPGEAAHIGKSVVQDLAAVRNIADDLQSEGLLRSKDFVEAQAKKGVKVPELLEELGDKPDLAKALREGQEYWLDQRALAEFKRARTRTASKEFRQANLAEQRGKGAERAVEREAALTEQQKRASLEGAELSPSIRKYLKGLPKPPRTLTEMQHWVDARVATGDIPANQRGSAVEFLRQRESALTRWAGREVRKLPPPPDSPFEHAGAEKRSDLASAATSGAGARKAGESEKRGWEIIHQTGEYLNATRPLVTSVDVSNPFRQTAQLTFDQIYQDLARVIVNPRAKVETSFRKNVTNMLKAFKNKEYAEQAFAALKADPWYKQAERQGLSFITEASPHEAWRGKGPLDKALDKLGVPGKPFKSLVDASERSFRYYQNKAMRDGWKFGMEYLSNLAEANPKYRWADRAAMKESLKTLVGHINDAGSRSKIFGTGKRAHNWNELTNNIFFSGQMNVARIKQLAKAATFYSTYESPLTRVYARRQFMRAVGGGAALTGLVTSIAYLAGERPQFELDSRSTDFGKVKVGNILWDGGAGYFQFIRVAHQMASGVQKTRGTGELRPRSLGDTLMNFARSKLAPGTGALYTYYGGKTFQGESVDPLKDPIQAAQVLGRDLLLPMSVRDVNDVLEENPRVAWLIPIMLMGSGLSSDAPSGSAWRSPGVLPSLRAAAGGKTSREVRLRDIELSNRQELRRRGVPPSNLTAGHVTLPARDKFGQPKKYVLSDAETEEFNAEFMPLVTELLNEFINSTAYRKLPTSTKSLALRNRVLALNQAYGTNTRARAKYVDKFLRGEIKPSKNETQENLVEFPKGTLSLPWRKE
jgi:hypothetical protein